MAQKLKNEPPFHPIELLDVEFLVGESKTSIMGNKSALAAASPVFKAMFYGNLAETKYPIKLADLCPEAFQVLLDDVNGGPTEFKSCQIAIDCYIAANKYLLTSLIKKSEDYMVENFDPEYGLKMYEVLKLHENKETIEKVIEKCQLKASIILQSKSFYEASVDTLIMLFGQEHLNIGSELELINALSEYIDSNEVSLTDKLNPKSKIRKALNSIRFLTLKPNEIVECAAIYRLLTPLEINGVLANIVSRISGIAMDENFSFLDSPRINIYPPKYLAKRTLCEIDSEKFVRQNSTSVITITASKGICIVGVILAVVKECYCQNGSDFNMILSVLDDFGMEESSLKLDSQYMTKKDHVVYLPREALLIRDEKKTLQLIFLKSVQLVGKYTSPSLSFENTTLELKTSAQNDAIHYLLKGFVLTKSDGKSIQLTTS